MHRTWWQRLPLFMPDDGAASGAAAGAAGQAQGNQQQGQQNQQGSQQSGAQGNQSGAAGLGHASAQQGAQQGAQGQQQQQLKQRPEWLGEKYWDATKGEAKVEELAKAEAAWRAQISRGDHKPPADPSGYKLDFANHADPDIKAAAAALIQPVQNDDGTTSPDPIMSAVQQAAHKAGVSQAGLQAITEAFLKGQAALLPAPFDEKAEMAKLGQNGPAMIKTLQDYAAEQLKRGRWDDADAERFRNYLYDAGDAQFLYKFLFDTGQVPEIKIAALTQQASTADASTLDAELAQIETDRRAGKITDAQAQQRFEENQEKRAKLYGKDQQRSWPPAA